MEHTVSIPVAHSKEKAISLDIPFYVYATVFASLSIIVGLIWDISWHMSIGRDGLLSPPHLAMYLGAIISGVFSGYQIIRTSFFGSQELKQASVRFWKIFYGSLGAMFCVWGAITMITSAPFDDWWHNTYGLDVTILSPPHTVLLLGMVGIQFGAMVSVMALQNREAKENESRKRVLNLIFSLTAGFFLTMVCTIISEYQGRHDMHNVVFYVSSAIFYPLLLSAFSRASKTLWGATRAALVYFIFQVLMNWILPLFPAEPMLGPILNPIDSFQAWEFPLLLFIPAVAIDVINRRKVKNDWLRALMIGPLFILILLAVQWNMGDFLMSEMARNWVFGQESWYFGSSPDWIYRYAYSDSMVSTGWTLVNGILIACGIAFLTSRVGLYWGNWMKKVQR